VFSPPPPKPRRVTATLAAVKECAKANQTIDTETSTHETKEICLIAEIIDCRTDD